jgi:CheY-like chemotaxis protein
MTPNTDDQARRTCLQAGADDFLATPVDPGDLKETIERHLSGE